MWKKLPLYAAVLVLCACSSAPEIQYPKGRASRSQINDDSFAGIRTTSANPAVVDNAFSDTPTALPVQLFFVNSNEGTAIHVLHRWASASKRGFTWTGDVDYSLTEQMRRIQEPTVELAVAAMMLALRSVKPALNLVISDTEIIVTSVPVILEIISVVPATVVRVDEPLQIILPPAPSLLAVPASTAVPPHLVDKQFVRPTAFSVLPSDKLMIPLFVRWAQSNGSAVVLNGSRVTTESLSSINYPDLPLTSAARKIVASTPINGIKNILDIYKSFGFNFEVKADMHGPNLLKITIDDKPALSKSASSL